MPAGRDIIFLHNLHLSTVTGPDAWKRPGKKQPLILSIRCECPLQEAGILDDITQTLSYGQICKDLTSEIEGQDWPSIGHLVRAMPRIANGWPVRSRKELTFRLPAALLRAEGGLVVRATLEWMHLQNGHAFSGWAAAGEWAVKRLKVACIIGVNPHERLEKQDVVIDISSNTVPLYDLCEDEALMAETERWRQMVTRTYEVCQPCRISFLSS